MAAVHSLHHRLASLCAAFVLLSQTPAIAISRNLRGEPGNAIARRADESKTFEIPFNITLSYGEVYGFNCSVGSPPQNITVGIRISSSSDTQFSNITDANPWDSFYNASLSTSSKRDVLPIRYDAMSPHGSSTNNSNLYNVSFAMVSYSSDDLVLPGTNKNITLDDVPFVGWTNTTFNWFRPWRPGDPWPYQWIGLGLPVGQISRWADGWGQSKPYPTFPQRLINTGTIESNTFSVWLDEVSKKTGHLLFGGLNLNRYQDSLVDLPTELVDTPEVQFGFLTQTQLGVTVDFIGLSVANSTNAIKLDAPLQVTLDHGIETRLPIALITAISAAVGANTNPDEHIDIKFLGASFLTLSVPMAHLTSRNGDGLDMSEGENAASCRLNIRAAEGGLPGSFGAGMLKNLYTVYDLDNNVISVALTDFSTTAADHLITIPSGGVSAISMDALTRPESGSAASPSSSSSGSVNGNTSGGGGVNGMAVGLGVGIPVAAILLGISALFLIRRRRREKSEYEAAKNTQESNGEMDGPGELGSKETHPHRNEMLGNPVSELQGKADVVSELPVSGTAPNTTQERHELA